jgi:hypothetical protein
MERSLEGSRQVTKILAGHGMDGHPRRSYPRELIEVFISSDDSVNPAAVGRHFYGRGGCR